MSTKKIDGFRNYGFASSTLVKGNFTKFNINPKLLVKDSNFNFDSTGFNVDSIDNIFDGCENAVFTHKLTLGEKFNSAVCMFRGCKHAYLPIVDILKSKLENCTSMFEGCENAKLNGITLPITLIKSDRMFMSCKSALFDEDLIINSNMTNCSNMFYDCKTGTFFKLTFDKFDELSEYDYSNMFYECECMDPNDLGFDNICVCVKNADTMFFNAGVPNSNAFDNIVLNFVKMVTCNEMFNSSRFSFDNTYIQFYKKGEYPISSVCADTPNSIKKIFYKCSYIKDIAPIIILGGEYTSDIDYINNNLSKCQKPYYTLDKKGSVVSGITDFSYAFYDTSVKTVDIRGICNNADLFDTNSTNVQNFTSMFENCRNLSTIKGYIPPYGYTYENLFKGCTNLNVDISKMFIKHTKEWKNSNNDYENVLQVDGLNGTEFSSYHMKNISGMFEGCKNIISKNDDFDLVGLVKTVYKNNDNDITTTEQSIKSAFPKLTLATKNPIYGLESVKYSINKISSKYNIVRYNSFEDEPYDLGDGDSSRFGIYSSFAHNMFGDGFLRFGGCFEDDPTKFFCVVYSNVAGKNVPTTKGFSYSIIPNGFVANYETDNTKNVWNTFKYNTLYLAKIYNVIDGTYVQDAYVGSYTRILTEKREVGGVTMNVSKEITMPVTWFESFSTK